MTYIFPTLHVYILLLARLWSSMKVRGRHPGKTSRFLYRTPDLVGLSFNVAAGVASLTVITDETASFALSAAAPAAICIWDMTLLVENDDVITRKDRVSIPFRWEIETLISRLEITLKSGCCCCRCCCCYDLISL